MKLYIGKDARAFGCLQRAVFQSKRLSMQMKRQVYKTAVMLVLMYGFETWAIKEKMNGACVPSTIDASGQ